MNRNLLILGTGGRGRMVKEIAEAMGIFENIDSLDDNTGYEGAIGLCSDYEKFAGAYSCAFPACADSKLRMQWIALLEECCFTIPVLIHPTAFISPSASVYPSTVVEAKAIISTNSIIERGCIVSVGAIVEHDAFIGYGCHIDSGAIVKENCVIKAHTVIESGKVVTRENLRTPQESLEANGYSFEVGV
ncbi:MAG: PglB [Syntrophomonadaceae bacterium]|jgi:carbonic anhydrase/acetyltransferase-like protein (isoleucine patch superfamily)